MPQPHLTRAVLAQLRALPGFPDWDVLDLSCGDGEILTRLADAGCRCRGTRYRSDDYILTDARHATSVEIDDGIDLLEPLPYADESFDVVLLVEVLEHLERHDVVTQQAARVLRSGGLLLVTSPNIHRLHSRWHFFLTGMHKLIRRPVSWDVTPDQWYAYHVRPLDFPVYHTLLFQQGLIVSALASTQFKWRHAVWLLFYPLVALASRWALRPRGQTPPLGRRGQRDLLRWLTHPALLASEQILLIATKTGPQHGTPAPPRLF